MKSLRPQIYVSDWTGLSLQLYHDTENFTNEERRHLFVMSVTPILVLMCARLGYGSQIAFPSECQSLVTLVESMVECAQLCLEKGYRNCGAFVELPWLTDLADLQREKASTAVRTALSLEKNPVFTQNLEYLEHLRNVWLQKYRSSYSNPRRSTGMYVKPFPFRIPVLLLLLPDVSSIIRRIRFPCVLLSRQASSIR